MRARGWIFLVSTSLAGVGVTSSARAGCPNVCDATLVASAIVPPLACAALEARTETCDCAMAIELRNRCAQPILAADFRFDRCGPSAGPYARDCTAVPIDEIGWLEVPLNETGTFERRALVSHDGVEHEIRVTAEVTSMGHSGCLCELAERGGSGGWLAALVLLAGGLVRRASRLSAARGRQYLPRR